MLRIVFVLFALLASGPAQSITLNLSGSASDLFAIFPDETIGGFVEFSDPIPAGDGAVSVDNFSIEIGGNTLTPTSVFFSVTPFINVTGGTISGLAFSFDGSTTLFGTAIASLVADGFGGLVAFDEFFSPVGFGDFQLVDAPVSVVPLPSSLPLFLTGLGGLMWLRTRRRKVLTAKQA